ncbi:MAG: aminotransferase class III-fold pyridoxal phosphate-dependent enzyme, partial [Arenicellales bacterium]
LTVLEILERENFANQAAQSGALLKQLLADALADKHGVKDVRGVGLLLAIELNKPCGELVMQAAEKGLLINVTADNVIRLLPPLVASESEIREIATRLIPLVEEFLNK